MYCLSDGGETSQVRPPQDRNEDVAPESNLKNHSSEQIITGIRHGCASHESEFYQRFHGPVIKFLSSYTSHPAHAEDIAQNALMIVLVKLRSSSIENPSKLSAYVFQTAKYSYYGGLRSAANRRQVDIQVDNINIEHRETTPDCIDHSISQERRLLVNKLIDRMEIPRDREILQRAYTYDEPKDSICESLRLSSLHFDCVIDRARKRFRRLLETETSEVQMALAQG
ncbi:MAG: RNA polymerase sigma-70 factor (ECF subfamily) [Candidatus Azotimanducaceae bacterium]|jgi:RNA polymerase sigma-70 factor (ECF subfamily)